MLASRVFGGLRLDARQLRRKVLGLEEAPPSNKQGLANMGSELLLTNIVA